MLIVEEKHALSELLRLEAPATCTKTGYIRAVVDVRRKKIILNAMDFPSLTSCLVYDGSDMADLYDLAITTSGKVFFTRNSDSQQEVTLSFAKIIQLIISSLLNFD